MNDQAIHADAHAAPAACENCAAPLQGRFCHECGQSVHSPVRHFGHAVEEFFEAFWHLDGRVFRTLRDLWVPGRVAINYLAGHRARYVAPLRLFVVLSVLTFFIGSITVAIDGRPAIDMEGLDRIEAAATPEEVSRIEEELVGVIEAAREAAGNAPGADPGLIAAEVRIRSAAANRRVELADPTVDPQAARSASGDDLPALHINLFGHKGAWHAEDNPLVIGWWPQFANDWLNRKVGRLQKNMHELEGDTNGWVQTVLASAPSALFLLVPLFAVLLKIAYLFSGRLYLEHLVVALYSHVFLLIMLSLGFVLAVLDNASQSMALRVLVGFGLIAITIWMPTYLLVMQKRVYRQAWWLTLLKYLVIGNIYFVLLTITTLLMFLARLAA